MAVEYLVLRADAETGPFARVRAEKLNRSWETLQDALDELGGHAWRLCTTIYTAFRTSPDVRHDLGATTADATPHAIVSSM